MYLIYIVLLLCTNFSIGFVLQGRIVNGTVAAPGEFPYIVSLRYNNRHTCGASILSEKYILTAAHCVHGRSIPSKFSVQYGTTHITEDDFQTIDVEKIIYHEGFVPTYDYRNDIAIIKLASSLPIGDSVQPTVLPPAHNPTPGGKEATLIGWGIPFSGGDLMLELQKVNINVYTDDECSSAYGERVNEKYHVCAGIREGGKGQCSGDSGGPLTVNGVQVGIVSWSVKPCTSPGNPGVFAKVSNYIDWIKAHMV